MGYEFIPLASAQKLYEMRGRPVECDGDWLTGKIGDKETEE